MKIYIINIVVLLLVSSNINYSFGQERKVYLTDGFVDSNLISLEQYTPQLGYKTIYTDTAITDQVLGLAEVITFNLTSKDEEYLIIKSDNNELIRLHVNKKFFRKKYVMYISRSPYGGIEIRYIKRKQVFFR